jgi:EAL domain-containing protein (putative c-di-GMP-specific phosphodiesterase class I)
VNLSPRQLRRPGLADRFVTMAARHGLTPDTVIFELTESAWTLDAGRVRPALEELREAGFALALDDFGAGYSSLSRLRDLPADVVKIDRAFLAGVPDEPDAVAVITAIRRLAQACRCDVVVEGVETEAQRRFLASEGLLLGQGFGLARPAPADEITPLLRESLLPARRSPVSLAG